MHFWMKYLEFGVDEFLLSRLAQCSYHEIFFLIHVFHPVILLLFHRKMVKLQLENKVI